MTKAALCPSLVKVLKRKNYLDYFYLMDQRLQ